MMDDRYDDNDHNGPPDDDAPRFIDDDTPDEPAHPSGAPHGYGLPDSEAEPPRAIPSDDLAGFIATLRGARAQRPPDPEPNYSDDDKAAIEADIQHFLQSVSRQSAQVDTPRTQAPAQPDFAPGTFSDDTAADEPTDETPPAPDNKRSEALDSDNAPDVIEPPPLEEPPRRLPPERPDPATQSAFVNPALARIAAARPKRAPREPSETWLGLRTVMIILAAAVTVSFIFSYWTPDSFLSDEFVANLQSVNSTQGPPTAVPSPLPTYARTQRIGIVTGHSGPPLDPTFDVDPGAVCDDNGDGIPELTELEVNTTVSLRVANLLVEAGYEVEMLNEWDPRLDNYRASVLISIHANTCENLGFGATGFNINIGELRRASVQDRDIRLENCLAAEYANATGLPRHFGTSPDLVDYHAFRKVSLDTPMAIVELGFMAADRQILTQEPDAMAQGVFEGIECFLNAQNPAS
ncbi:MAG: N-acetylmuramoyl-L-alanine amidase [Anaerolineales bacterium]